MNIFASGRITPANINFPKGMDKINWHVVTTCKDFVDSFTRHKVSYVVLDSAGYEDGSAYKLACAITEVTIDKHSTVPILMVVGPNAEEKARIDAHMAKAKKWIDISRGK